MFLQNLPIVPELMDGWMNRGSRLESMGKLTRYVLPLQSLLVLFLFIPSKTVMDVLTAFSYTMSWPSWQRHAADLAESPRDWMR